jgi:hypothetical protein
MPIQAGKYDVDIIRLTAEGVQVTLRDPDSNQPVHPTPTQARLQLQLAETRAKRFLDDCQYSLDRHRDEWDDLMQHRDNPKQAGLWRDEYEHIDGASWFVAGICDEDQFVLIVRDGRVVAVVYEGQPPRDLPALRSITLDTKECRPRPIRYLDS